MRRATAGTATIAGLVLGVLVGFLLLEGPPIGLIVVVGAAVLVRAFGQALAGSAALLGGIGAAWLALLGRVKLTCMHDPAISCPSIDLYLVVAVALIAAGVGLDITRRVRTQRFN